MLRLELPLHANDRQHAVLCLVPRDIDFLNGFEELALRGLLVEAHLQKLPVLLGSSDDSADECLRHVVLVCIARPVHDVYDLAVRDRRDLRCRELAQPLPPALGLELRVARVVFEVLRTVLHIGVVEG